jgi:hypothetical protein
MRTATRVVPGLTAAGVLVAATAALVGLSAEMERLWLLSEVGPQMGDPNGGPSQPIRADRLIGGAQAQAGWLRRTVATYS